jgi:phosphoribosylanthranilate isomerase
VIRVKICGITRVEDALAAAQAGADAIGLVFVERSPRHVELAMAASICRVLPPFVSRVGLFMNAEAERVHEALAETGLDWLQFHGQEGPDYCRQFRRPWIKAIAMGEAEIPDVERFAQADALLLDSHGSGQQGGSGKTFDWSRVPELRRPWVLAGGLNPDNVAAACQQLRPDAVDVSSGVETRPGIKSDKLMNEFIKAVKNG